MMLKNKNIVVIVFAVFFLLSCHIKPAGTLSEKKMEDILYEMHKSEGIVQAQGYFQNTSQQQKEYYDQILKKYKVTQAEFDSTLAWYTKHPLEFSELYKKVIVRFDTLNTQVSKGKFHPLNAQNGMMKTDLWKLRRTFKLNKDSARTKIDFEIVNSDNLFVGDKYTLSFLHRVAKSDSSVNPYAVLRINYTNGKKDTLLAKSFNDNKLRRFKIILFAKDSSRIKSLSGCLLGNKTPKGSMNATVDSIKLTREFNIYKQNNIRNRVSIKERIPVKK